MSSGYLYYIYFNTGEIAMQNIFFTSLIISMILFYIYDTNVISAYLKLAFSVFKRWKWAGKFFGGRLFLAAYSPVENGPYLQYLNSIYRNFFSELIACEICVGAWLALGASLLIGNMIYFGSLAVFSLLFYYLIKILTKHVSRL